MNQPKNINYLSLDLELNNKNDGTTPKIIEVGVCVGSPVNPEEIQKYNWYMDPQEPITPFITELTGITDEIIQEKSVSHETVAEELGEIIKQNQCFVNPICWGGSGFSSDASELKEEFNQRNIHFPFFGRRIFDVKTLYVFQQMTSGRNSRGGLKSALSRNKLEFIGEPHRASDDAFNTLRLFFYYINRYKKLQKTIQDLKDTF